MKIEWSEQSRNDLYDILSYVVEIFGRRTAELVLAEIRSRADLLRNFPVSGRVFVKDTELGITYRAVTTKLNKIVYFIDDDKTIIIVAVWQNRQDINRLKKKLTE
ncbi:MAG: type II toxin-antitoxin system RelE/ParE family toxin [Bacteroidales bacterium]|nr:type II toxin-antitoxin system RelE/ParE family toxin [Bacteroidales bacterium]